MLSYEDRFNEVLKHIHFHLDGKLDLDELANIALVSKYHFHRMMKSYLGESLGSYINRIKVEKGARLLKYSNDSVTEIAFKIGYETPTSFNKSFKKQFGASPSQYRKAPNHSFGSIMQTKQKTSFDLKVEQESIRPVLILTKQSKGLVGSTQTNIIWGELMAFAAQNKLLTPQTRLFGIHWDDPSITAKENLRYDACISIEKPIQSAAFMTKKIEGGRYLCFTYQGNYQYIGDVYDQIFKEYILTKNIELREEPLFDQYLNDLKQTATEDLLTKIFIPVT